jgi:hypothetical protein
MKSLGGVLPRFPNGSLRSNLSNRSWLNYWRQTSACAKTFTITSYIGSRSHSCLRSGFEAHRVYGEVDFGLPMIFAMRSPGLLLCVSMQPDFALECRDAERRVLGRA